MIVVSDTTPIISLMKAGQLKLLQKLFGVVYIPGAVYRELTENEAFCDEVRMVQECEFLYMEGCIEQMKERGIRISEKLYQKLREHMGKIKRF